jgi:hypothetical protein
MLVRAITALLRVAVSWVAVAIIAVVSGVVRGLIWTAALFEPVAIIVKVGGAASFSRHVEGVWDG